jgi:UDP-N-acetylglucosamine 4-epimerase
MCNKVQSRLCLAPSRLGSVPRSINEVTTNDVNIAGFEYVAALASTKVKRFVYAASSSTYGDSEALPKVEDVIESPFALCHYEICE